MKSSMTATGPCSQSSAALLAPTRAMVMIGATVMPASSRRHASRRAGRQSSLARSLCRMLAVCLTFRRCRQLRSQPAQLIFYAFDLLHLDGKDLREKPLIERRTKLKRLIEQDPDNRIQFSEEFIGVAAAFMHVPRMSWKASSPNSQPLDTAAVEARPGSRPSA